MIFSVTDVIIVYEDSFIKRATNKQTYSILDTN